MRTEHRHELKTNELAEWLTHLPQWSRDNATFLIGTAAVIVVAAALYLGIFYRRNVVLANERARLTGLVTQLPFQKIQVIQGQMQGKDQSYMLVAAANTLQEFAQTAKDDRMAAMALIERAETLRAELHYRTGNIPQDEMSRQIEQARQSYEEAIRRASSLASLAGQAKYGLGLCEEELGNFDKAEQIYREVGNDSKLDGTAAKAAAQHRLKVLADYKETVLFRPAAPQVPVVIPEVTAKPPDVPSLAIAAKPGEPNVVVQPAKTAADGNQSAPKPATSPAADTNRPRR